MNRPREGDLYREIEIYGKIFRLYFGYYDEKERYSKYNDPIPIYPDFCVSPEYTDEGHPFVTQMQDACQNGDVSPSEGCCYECKYYKQGEDLIGICLCEKNRK